MILMISKQMKTVNTFYLKIEFSFVTTKNRSILYDLILLLQFTGYSEFN